MATRKKYRANTDISINVVLSSGKSLHVSFTPQSDGGSVMTTDNEEVQGALERHYRYGSLFRLESEEAENAAEAEATAAPPEAAGLERVAVSDIASAKDYLADKFGISRTAMRTTSQIVEQAAAHGIEFEGI